LEIERLHIGITKLEEWGYRVEVAQHALQKKDYFAGSDEERLEDIIQAFTNPEVNGVICSRGGYGSARLLQNIPWDVLADLPPKVFVGFSDIGAIMLQLWARSRWISFAGPQVAMALSSDLSHRTIDHFKGMLDGTYRSLSWPSGEEVVLHKVRGGEVSGVLVPCCLSILVSLIGTPNLPDLSGTILCIEDLNEPPYRIDRMLWQLSAAGALSSVGGLVLGHFLWEDKDISVEVSEIILDLFDDFSFSVYRGLPFGHVDDRLTLPVGVSAKITAAGVLCIYDDLVEE